MRNERQSLYRGWPLPAMGWAPIKGGMVGTASACGVTVLVKILRQRSLSGTAGAAIARNRFNKLLIIPLAAALLIIVLALVQWYWYF